jgi:hypothetical protein
MSLTVVFRETALRNLARIRGDDKDLFTHCARGTLTIRLLLSCTRRKTAGYRPPGGVPVRTVRSTAAGSAAWSKMAATRPAR